MYRTLIALFLVHAASAQSNPAAPVVSVQGVPVVFVSAVNTSATAPRDDDPSCKVLEQVSAAGSKCLVSGCYAYTRIVCNNASNADITGALDFFHKNKPFVTTAPDLNFNPIHFRLNGGALNFSRDIFNTSNGGSFVQMIDTVELTGTDIGANADNAFDGLVNMTKLSLDRVPVESIGPATFDGLSALKTVYLTNLYKLKKINTGFADALVNSNNFKCLRVDIANADNLVCDCNGVTAVQNYRKNYNATARALQDKANAMVYNNCDVSITCTSGSQKVNMKDVNVNELCKQATDKNAGTTSTPKTGSSATSFHGNVLVVLASVLIVGVPAVLA